MRIGVSGYIGKKKTGIGRVLENVIFEVAKTDPSITYYVFVNFDQNELFINGYPENIKLIPYNVSKYSPILNIIWHQFFYQLSLIKYACELSFIPNFSLILWKNRPTISIIHDLIEFNVPSKFSKIRMFYRRIAVPLMAYLSDTIITVSNTSKSDIIKFIKIQEQKIQVIYNGIDTALFNQIPATEYDDFLQSLSLQKDEFILYVGTIDHPGKNLYSLLISFLELKEEGKIFDKLVIVGQKGFNHQTIFDLISKSKFKNDIVVLGYVKDEQLPYLYNAARVFCYLSLYEGFGLPVIEAMACNCPVIASNSSSIKEIVNNFGISVDPLNISQIKLALTEIIESVELRTEMRIAGLKYVKKFDLKQTAIEYLNVFKEHSF